MQLRHLRYFLEVLESQNLSRAAEKLNISQPALTKAIQRLEEELCAPLFVRDSRGVTPTEFAESLRGFARASVVGYRQSLQELEAVRGGKKGTVTIAAPPMLVASMLPGALIAFHKDNPDVRVLVKIAIEELFDVLADGQCDLVLAMRPKPDKRFEGFEEQLFADDRMAVIARPGHPALKQTKPAVKQLSAYSWALSNAGSILRERIEGIFQEAGEAPPHCAIECLAADLIKQMVQGTDLLGWVPEASCTKEIATGTLVEIKVSSKLAHRKIGVFWNSYHFTPAAKALKKAIVGMPRGPLAKL